MRGAELSGIVPRAEIFAGLQRRHAETGAQHRHVDMSALPAAGHTAQHRGDGKGGKEPGADIRHRHAGLHRSAVGFAGDAHDAARRLHGDVETALAGARPGLAEGGDRAIDQARLLGAERLVAQPEAVHHARAVVFQDDVSRQDKPAGRRLVLGIREVEARPERLLRLIDAKFSLKPCVIPRPLPHPVTVRRFDLDHLVAFMSGQQHAAVWPRQAPAEFDDLHAGERQHPFTYFFSVVHPGDVTFRTRRRGTAP